jgi:hypothetical protein
MEDIWWMWTCFATAAETWACSSQKAILAELVPVASGAEGTVEIDVVEHSSDRRLEIGFEVLDDPKPLYQLAV